MSKPDNKKQPSKVDLAVDSLLTKIITMASEDDASIPLTICTLVKVIKYMVAFSLVLMLGSCVNSLMLFGLWNRDPMSPMPVAINSQNQVIPIGAAYAPTPEGAKNFATALSVDAFSLIGHRFDKQFPLFQDRFSPAGFEAYKVAMDETFTIIKKNRYVVDTSLMGVAQIEEGFPKRNERGIMEYRIIVPVSMSIHDGNTRAPKGTNFSFVFNLVVVPRSVHPSGFLAENFTFR
jgi:hypothetical protein